MGRGLEEHKVIKQNKELRCGFTTGSCAAAAAKWSRRGLAFWGIKEAKISLLTPAGIRLFLPWRISGYQIIRFPAVLPNDAGDDPDVTDGIHIYAEVKKSSFSREFS